MAQPAIATAYRQLYRAGLKAVRYSTPQRHVLRWTLRSAFRSGSPSEFDSNKIAQTILFLERAAASSASLEHKIVKNLLHVRFWEQSTRRPRPSKQPRDAAQRYLGWSANTHFNSTLMLLNESLGTCLR